jgi:hypothetical protein
MESDDNNPPVEERQLEALNGIQVQLAELQGRVKRIDQILTVVFVVWMLGVAVVVLQNFS